MPAIHEMRERPVSGNLASAVIPADIIDTQRFPRQDAAKDGDLR